jgi:hypothetical protein
VPDQAGVTGSQLVKPALSNHSLSCLDLYFRFSEFLRPPSSQKQPAIIAKKLTITNHKLILRLFGCADGDIGVVVPVSANAFPPRASTRKVAARARRMKKAVDWRSLAPKFFCTMTSLTYPVSSIHSFRRKSSSTYTASFRQKQLLRAN